MQLKITIKLSIIVIGIVAIRYILQLINTFWPIYEFIDLVIKPTIVLILIIMVLTGFWNVFKKCFIYSKYLKE